MISKVFWVRTFLCSDRVSLLLLGQMSPSLIFKPRNSDPLRRLRFFLQCKSILSSTRQKLQSNTKYFGLLYYTTISFCITCNKPVPNDCVDNSAVTTPNGSSWTERARESERARERERENRLLHCNAVTILLSQCSHQRKPSWCLCH